MNTNISSLLYGRYCIGKPAFFALFQRISFFLVLAFGAVQAYCADVDNEADIPENTRFFSANFPDFAPPVLKGEPVPGKLSLVKFYTDYCYPCAQVDAGAFADEGLLRYMRQYYNPYKVDGYDEQKGGRELAWEYKVHTFPTILITDPNGHELRRISGNVSAAELQAILAEYEAQALYYRSAVRAATLPVLPASHIASYESEVKPAAAKPVAEVQERFGLLVQVAADYYEARKLAQLYRNSWGDDVWIEPNRKGAFSLICGAYRSRQDALTARDFFRTWESVKFRILSLSDTCVSY